MAQREMAMKRDMQTSGMILLLSSEPVVGSVLKQVLEDGGYTVILSGNLGEAVDRLAECSFDLLITHPYIANIPGHEAARYLHAKNPRMGVMIIAGLLEDDRLRNRADLEGFENFPKPFSGGEFLNRVHDLLRSVRRRARREKGVQSELAGRRGLGASC